MEDVSARGRARQAYLEYLDFRSKQAGEMNFSGNLLMGSGGRTGDFNRGYTILGRDSEYYDHRQVLVEADACYFDRQADLAIVVPVDTVGEGANSVVALADRIERAAGNIPLTDIFLWCNGRHSGMSSKSVIEAETLFEDLERRLCSGPVDSDRIRIALGNQNIPKEWGFNEIRAGSMDSLAYMSITHYLPFELPVLWLDVDTPEIKEDTLAKIHSAVKDRKAYFVKAQLKFVDDRPDKPPPSEQKDADKVANIYADARFLLEQCLEPTDSRGYVDECGLAFMLGNYMLSGGIALTHRARGESRTLLTRAGKVFDTSSIPLLMYLDDAVISTSDRRFRLLAHLKPPIELPRSEQGPSYRGYSGMKPKDGAALPDRPALRDEVDQMTRYMMSRQEKRIGKSTPRATVEAIGALVDKSFPV